MGPIRHPLTPERLFPVAVAILLLGAALVWGSGSYPLLEPDEGRNAEVAREMAASGDYVVPHLDGLPYPDKPALYFAAVAVSLRALGHREFAARLPSLLATLGTLGLVAWFARRRYGNAGAWTAVIVTGTAPLTIAFARTVIFDSTLAFFVTAAVLAFVRSGDGADSAVTAGSWKWGAAAWSAIGLGILTKGPIALALPLMVVMPWAVWRRRWRALFDPVGVLCCVAIVAPWTLAMSQQVPEFFRYALVTETAARLTTTALGRTGPLWYFLPILLAGALPWSFVLLAGGRGLATQLKARNADAWLLVSWVLIPLVFFSLSQSKRPQYLVPLMPGVGMLVAHLWRDGPGRLAGARIVAVAMIGLGVAVGVGSPALARGFGASAAVLATVPVAGWMVAALSVVGGALAFARPAHRLAVVVGLALPVAALPVAGRAVIEHVASERSAADLAQAIRPVVTRGVRVAAAGTFPLSLPYYLGMPLLLATPDGAELTSNYIVRFPGSRYVEGTPIRPADWWRDAVSTCDRPIIVVVRQDDRARRAVLQARVPLLIETTRYAVYGPCGRSNLALSAAPPATSPF